MSIMWEPMSAMTPGAAAGPPVSPRERGRGIHLSVGEVGHPPVADLAEVPLVDQAPEVPERGGEPERERDHVHPPGGAVGGVGQGPGLGVRDRQRLLAEDVLPGGDRGGGDRKVQIARGTDHDRVELGVGHQGLPGGVDPRDLPALREGAGAAGITGRDGRHFAAIRREPEARQVHEGGDTAGPDHAHANPLAHRPLPSGHPSDQGRSVAHPRVRDARPRLARFPDPQKAGRIAPAGECSAGDSLREEAA